MSPLRGFALGALCCALAVIAGAFGAHGLKARLDAGSLELWKTAAQYLFYAGIAQMVVGVAGVVVPAGGLRTATLLLLAGGLVFSGTVFVLALGGPRWLGAVTPLGGLLMIAGFVIAAWAAFAASGP